MPNSAPGAPARPVPRGPRRRSLPRPTLLSRARALVAPLALTLLTGVAASACSESAPSRCNSVDVGAVGCGCREDSGCAEGLRCNAAGTCERPADRCTPLGTSGCSCDGAADCEPGLACLAGACAHAACTEDAQCAPRGVCARGQCVAYACTDDSECPKHARCDGGHCVQTSCAETPETLACFTAAAATPRVGACDYGVWACAPEATEPACTGEVTPRRELCNGVDDDCNGAVDDAPLDAGQPCDGTTGCVGACCAGTTRCVDKQLVCDSAAASTPEVCGNRVDDDCDGVTDCPAGCTAGEPGCGPCATDNGGCDARTTCTPTADGGRACGPCPTGFDGDGATGCTNVDECATGNGGCAAGTTCTDTEGGRECGPCPAGTVGSGERGCSPFTGCATQNGGCDPRVSCMADGDGLRTCGPCPLGFTDVSGDGTLCRKDPFPREVDTSRFTGVTVSGVADDRQLGYRNAPFVDYGQSYERGFGGPAMLAADLDGDGMDDLVVGSPRSRAPARASVGPCGESGRAQAGAAYVFFGRALPADAGALDTADADVTIYPPCAGDRLGGALAAGDFDGDGKLDLAVGAHHGSFVKMDGTRRAGVGAVYVFKNARLQRGAKLDLAVDGTRASWTLGGPASGSEFGGALAAADFGGDGIDDLAVGAPGVDTPGAGQPAASDIGAAFVFLGIRNWPDGQVTDLFAGGNAAARLAGIESGDEFGAFLAAGDTDGDGRADLLVGAPEHDRRLPADDTRSQYGAAFLWRAPEGGFSGNLRAYDDELAEPSPKPAAPPTAVFWNTDSRGGESAILADVTGDGRADVLLGWALAPYGLPQPRARGLVRMYQGRAWAEGAVFDAAAAAPGTDVTLTSSIVYASFGAALAAGDVDADGTADLVVGAPDAGDQAGAAYLWWGGSAALDGSLPAADETSAAFRAFSGRGEHGGQGLAVGDWNGDGFADVLYAAPSTPANTAVGRVYVILGGPRP